MLNPAYTYTCLLSAVIMISTSIYVIYKIHKGSKSTFAYLLMAFTLLDGAQNFTLFFFSAHRRSIYLDGQTHYFINMYASQTATFCYYLVSLQSWIFGMKYLESAMFCSLTPPCITSLVIRYIKWAGISIYTFLMLAMFVWGLIIFPGYVNDGTME